MSKQGNKLADKKKNDLLKKFLNAQQYTKNLKKNASNLKDQSNYATYSYDQIQTYPEMPQSAKLPSTMLHSKDITYSMNTMNDDFEQLDRKVKTKKELYNTTNQLSMSSNQVAYSSKVKKSTYSLMQKSEGASKTLKRQGQTKSKQYDVHSQTKQKHSNSMVLHQSCGGLKTQSFFKLKNKKSFNYSNANQYQSDKLSQQVMNSFQGQRKMSQIQGKVFKNNKLKQNKAMQQYKSFEYSLCPQNFMKLLNKVQQLQSAIILYQQAIKQLKKKIINLNSQNKQIKMSQIYIDSLKQDIMLEKNKNNSLRQKIQIQQSKLKQYEKVIFCSIQKIGQDYKQEIERITQLEKQNQFLKYMLKLDFQFQTFTASNSLNLQKQNNFAKYSQQQQQSSNTIKPIQLSKNIHQFKQKIGIKQNKKKVN